VAIDQAAFAGSKMLTMLFGARTAESNAVLASRHQLSWSTDPTSHYLKATNPSGEMNAIAIWNIYTVPTLSQDPWPKLHPSSTNKALAEHYFGRLVEFRKETMGARPYLLMADLAMLPQYQRMGVGRKLLDWSLRVTDDKQLDCWIDASPQGLGCTGNWGGLRWLSMSLI
jgi:hypothetical protein